MGDHATRGDRGRGDRYAVLKPPKRARRSAASPGARLAERRQMEAGDPRKWYPARDKILAALRFASTVKMSFWESVPPDELELALDEIEELYEAAGDALAAGESDSNTKSTGGRSRRWRPGADGRPPRSKLWSGRSRLSAGS